MARVSSSMRDVEPWFNHRLVIRKSEIHGLGLFANSSIRKGEDILRFGGCFFHISNRHSHFVMPSTSVPVSEEIILAESCDGKKDVSDYINHSCDPNAGFRDAITLVAIKNISPAEEIVVDYSFWECDSEWKLKEECSCGSAFCRKQVTGNDWEKIRPKDPIFRFYSPFLRRRIKSRLSIKQEQ